MKDWSKKQISEGICCTLVCLFICGLAFFNRTLTTDPVQSFVRGEASFDGMKHEIQEAYTGDRLRWKDQFITLNGGYGRLCGRNRYNQVLRMRNGMLKAADSPLQDMQSLSEAITGLYRFLSREDIRFLYVMAPYKNPLTNDALPYGAEKDADSCNAIADDLLTRLREARVPCLDLRETLSATLEQVDRYFYRTDHHWNVDGSFRGYQQIMQKLTELYPSLTARYTDAALWEKHVIPDWWLGSHGLRVGHLFAGWDDLTYMLPRFETDMTWISPLFGFRHGSFEQANISQNDIILRNIVNYGVYIGSDYPLNFHRNRNAPNPIRVLVLKDSFMLPVQAFLSTEFMEIDVIDPRYYHDVSVLEYIALNPPDLVIMQTSPMTSSDQRYAELGEAEGIARPEAALFSAEEIPFPWENGDGCFRIPVTLEACSYYEVTVGRIEKEEGNPVEGVNFELIDPETEETVRLTTVDIEYGNRDGFRWAFRTPESGEYSLLLFSDMDKDPSSRLTYYQVRLNRLSGIVSPGQSGLSE